MQSGICTLCDTSIKRNIITKHLAKCIPRSLLENSPENVIMYISQISVSGRYWLYFLTPIDSKLSEIDKFVRNIWLKGKKPGNFSYLDERKRKTIDSDTKLSDMLPLNRLRCEYRYPKLEIDILTKMRVDNKQIKLLNRNETPPIPCDDCKKAASVLCAYCKCFYCQPCSKNYDKHQCLENHFPMQKFKTIEKYTEKLVNTPIFDIRKEIYNKILDFDL